MTAAVSTSSGSDRRNTAEARASRSSRSNTALTYNEAGSILWTR
jgi:hypothetical protein